MASEHKLGDISFTGKDMPQQSARYDRLAVDDRGTIMILSVVCESQYVKAIRAILNGGAKCDIQASGGKIRKPDAKYGYSSNPGRLRTTSDSYDLHTQKLKYGQVHALFMTRMRGFMPVAGQERLWQELMDTRFTTPLLKEWLPYVERRLKELDLLRQCDSFNYPYARPGEEPEVMRCAVLDATTDHLDDIVSTGIRSGQIAIPGPKSRLDLPVIHSYSAEEAEADGVIQIIRPETPSPKSYKVGVIAVGETKPSYNGLRFSTPDEAEHYARDLMSRWTAMKSFEIEASDDEPNR